MIKTLMVNDLCMKCLRPGHCVKQCKSLHRCRKCQTSTSHFTARQKQRISPSSSYCHSWQAINPIPVHSTTKVTSNSLLMTCRILVDAPDGMSVEARALLDCASSASFISEHHAQNLCLHCSSQNVRSLDSFTTLLPNLLSTSLSPSGHLGRKSMLLLSLFNVSPATCPFTRCRSMPIRSIWPIFNLLIWHQTFR